MERTRLGGSGLEVSKLAFGASALGGVYGPVGRDEAVATVRTALELGIDLFDTAPAYGGGRAEQLLGEALRGVPRERYALSTKVGKHTDPERYGHDRFDFSARGVRRSVEASMERLGVERLDIVHLHDFDYRGQRHADQALAEGLPALRELESAGRIRAVGAGIYAMDLWKRVLLEADVDVILVHNHATLADIRLVELLPLARRAGVGVINAAPFGSGLLTGREPPAWHPATPAERSLFREAAAWCLERGTTLAELALRFSHHGFAADTTLFSAADPAAVRRSVAWSAAAPDPALVAGVQRILEPVMNRQWDY